MTILPLQTGNYASVAFTRPIRWKGSCNGIVGIFPSNYVSKLDDGAQKVTQRIIPDESAELLQQLGSVQALKIAIQKADPLGHNPQENEALQVIYQLLIFHFNRGNIKRL